MRWRAVLFRGHFRARLAYVPWRLAARVIASPISPNANLDRCRLASGKSASAPSASSRRRFCHLANQPDICSPRSKSPNDQREVLVVQSILILLLLLPISDAARAQTTCKQFSFTAEVKAGESFRRPIGSDLLFGVEPEETNNIHGWHFGIGPTVRTADDNVLDYIFVVTPPYHFRHPTDLTTDYGVAAQYAVKPGQIWFWFVLSYADAKVASAALDHDIWPQNDIDVANQGKVRERLPKGRGEFVILDSKFTPGEIDKNGNCEREFCGKMKSIRFRVTMVVPPTFTIASGLRTTPESCPGRWE